MVPSRIIKQYISHCQETQFKIASERAFYRIIDVCTASRQKSLQGFDYFLTEGARAFESVKRVIVVLEEEGAISIWEKEAKAILKEAKRYLKTSFKSHVGVTKFSIFFVIRLLAFSLGFCFSALFGRNLALCNTLRNF